MITNHQEIIEAIKNQKLKEHFHHNIEVKSNWEIKDGLKISGLANKIDLKVAWLIIGVDDSCNLTGKDEKWVKATEQIISQQINENLDPYVACRSIRCETINNNWIIIIEVQQPGEVVDWQGKAYKASGTSYLEMPPQDRVALTIKLPGLEDYTAQQADIVIDDNLVNEFINQANNRGRQIDKSIQPPQILQSLNIYKKNVSRILFGDFKFRVVKYNSAGEPIQNDAKKGLINVFGLVQEIQDWTQSNNSLNESYPEKALKEALANAVAHASYYNNDGEILIELFPEKLSISNLCLPQTTAFANKWFSRSRLTTNKLLMETLRFGGYVDELGIGKNIIYRECIFAGKNAPIVDTDRAGKLQRWRITLYATNTDKKYVQLFGRLKKIYTNLDDVLIANALVLWRNKTVSEIRVYIDSESYEKFARILADPKGPIFYWRDRDLITLRRWAKVVLLEGKDSKSFSEGEEEDLKNFAYKMQTQFNRGFMTPKDLRGLADMGDTPSEQQLSLKLIKKWLDDSVLEREKKGIYKFVSRKSFLDVAKELSELLNPQKQENQ